MHPARRFLRRTLLALATIALALGLWVAFWKEAPPRPSGAWMQRSGMRPRLVTVNGQAVRVAEGGSGPALILLHGFAASMHTWADLWPELVKTNRVVALDLPPFGGSLSDAPPAPAEYPRLIVSVMDQLGLARATLVGNSLGGAVSIALAAHHPERVERLVLIDAAGYNFDPRDRPWLLRHAGSPIGGAIAEALPNRRALVRTGLRQVFHDPSLATEEQVEEYLAPLVRPGTMRQMQTLLRRANELGFPEVIKSVRAPTLVIWGAEDGWIPVRDAQRFAADIPGARVEILPDCGHIPQEERPRDVLRLIRSFVP